MIPTIVITKDKTDTTKKNKKKPILYEHAGCIAKIKVINQVNQVIATNIQKGHKTFKENEKKTRQTSDYLTKT